MQRVLRTRLTPDQIKITKALLEKKRVMVLSCHSSGKCMWQNEWVYLANGKKVRAKSLVGKEFTLLTVGPDGPIPVKAKADWNEEEEIYEIITESGRKISG